MMHGTVEVFSTLGKGSQFVVTLPMHRSMGLVLHRDAAQPQFTGPGLPGVRLLVVDDNETNQEIAAHILQAEGAVVAVAGHGQAALDMLQARPDDFDAVLMDVHMPVLNGLDATRQIRANARLAGLPVIGLTAGVSLSEQKEAMGAGMNAVVGKPFDPAALVRTLWRSLPHLAPGVDAAERAGAPSGNNPGVGAGGVPADWPSLPGVSAEQSHTRLKGHAPLLWQLARRIVACVDGLPSGVPANSAAPETSSTSEMSTNATFTEAEMDAMKLPLHDLKGMAGSIGAQALHALAAQAEDAARQHQPETLAQLLPQLRPAVRGWDVAMAQSQPGALQAAGEVNKASGVGGADGAEGPQAAQAAGAQAASAIDAALLERIALLRGALQQRDLAALDEWEALAPDLGGVLGRERNAALQQHLDALAFDEALAVLDSALPAQA
jgi:CheY-like chemotaxis protein